MGYVKAMKINIAAYLAGVLQYLQYKQNIILHSEKYLRFNIRHLSYQGVKHIQKLRFRFNLLVLISCFSVCCLSRRS